MTNGFKKMVGDAARLGISPQDGLRAAVRLTGDEVKHGPDGKFVAGGPDKKESAKAVQHAFNRKLNAGNAHAMSPSPERKTAMEKANAEHEAAAEAHEKRHDQMAYMMRQAQKMK